MRSLFLDASVLVYAFGEAHRWREPCQQVVESRVEGRARLHISSEAAQEFLYHRMRRTERNLAARQVRDVLGFCTVHPFDVAVLDRSVELIEHTSVRGRDAVHAATALEKGFTEIVSTDPDFDDIPGLRRIDPTDLSG